MVVYFVFDLAENRVETATIGRCNPLETFNPTAFGGKRYYSTHLSSLPVGLSKRYLNKGNHYIE